MVFIDTNVFIAYLKTEDKFQKDAERILNQIHTGKITGEASAISLLEICYVLKKIGRKEKEISSTIHAVLSIDNLRFLPITAEIFREAIDLCQNYKMAISDAIIATTCMRLGAKEMVSEDSDFDLLPQNLVKRVTMKEAAEVKDAKH